MCALIKQEVASGNNGWGVSGGDIAVTSRPTTLEYRPVTWAPPTLHPIALPTIRPITLQTRPLGFNVIQPQLNPTIYRTQPLGVPAVGQVGLPQVSTFGVPQIGVPRVGLPMGAGRIL